MRSPKSGFTSVTNCAAKPRIVYYLTKLTIHKGRFVMNSDTFVTDVNPDLLVAIAENYGICRRAR
jgi:hypothetical protein